MTTGNTTGFDRDDDGDLRDPLLRRALDHAPDSNATPDARTRDAILKMAHNLAAVPAATRPAANSANTAPWWRRVFGGGGEPRSRMPWNAAFATVLVATFVTVLWHREPVPDAQLDGEARVAGAAAPAQAPAASAPVPVPVPAQPSADAAPPAELPAAVATPEPAPPAAATVAPKAQVDDPKKQQQAKAQRDSFAKEAAGAAGADAVRRAAPPPPSAPSPQAASPAPILPAPAAPAVAAALPPAIVAERAAPPPASPREERVESERRRAYVGESPPLASAPAAAPASAPVFAPPPAPITAPAPAAVAPPQIAAAPPTQDLKSKQSAFADQAGHANADVSGALRSPAPRAAVATRPARPQGPASFSALDRWTSFSFAGSGAEVRHARSDIEGLPALVGTVARSATNADEPLAAPVDARLSLYRGGTLIAVLEIAGAQVRWTVQPGGAALVGTPPAQTLDALRSLLTR